MGERGCGKGWVKGKRDKEKGDGGKRERRKEKGERV